MSHRSKKSHWLVPFLTASAAVITQIADLAGIAGNNTSAWPGPLDLIRRDLSSWSAALVVAALVVTVWSLWLDRRHRDTPPGQRETGAREVVDLLAAAVDRRWRHEERHYGRLNPTTLPVRWHAAAPAIVDHDANISLTPLGKSASPVDVTGDLHAIAEVYARIASGRLVVLGAAGSGKTILTRRFVTDYLPARGEKGRVPVIVSVGGWDPTAVTLRAWLTLQLLRDYPGCPELAEPVEPAGGRRTHADELVNGGHIVAVLDGFDEIAPALRHLALREINAAAIPYVLTSRPAEYEDAVLAEGVLACAAVVELERLSLEDITEYLSRTARRVAPATAPAGGLQRPATVWDPVIAHLTRHPHTTASANIVAALSTPLMVGLARTVYTDNTASPSVLLDTGRFPTVESIEEHLLASFVPTVYRRRPSGSDGQSRPRDWGPDRAQRWLGVLARHMNATAARHDLAWWRLGDAVPLRQRVFAVGLAAMLVGVGGDLAIFGPILLGVFGIQRGVPIALVDALIIGVEVAVPFALVYWLMSRAGRLVFEPSRVLLRLRGRRSRAGGTIARVFATRVGYGIFGGYVFSALYAPSSVLMRGRLAGFPATDVIIKAAVVNTVLLGGVLGLVAGLTFGVTAILETPLDLDVVTRPVDLLAANRETALGRMAIAVPAIAVGVGLGGHVLVEALDGLVGPLVWDTGGGLFLGAVAGFIGAVCMTLGFTAWGQWVLARVWLAMTGRLPWALVAFLTDAYDRDVLRHGGAVYQFRHARLQEHLGRAAKVG